MGISFSGIRALVPSAPWVSFWIWYTAKDRAPLYIGLNNYDTTRVLIGQITVLDGSILKYIKRWPDIFSGELFYKRNGE